MAQHGDISKQVDHNFPEVDDGSEIEVAYLR